jgi:hypothetical protein
VKYVAICVAQCFVCGFGVAFLPPIAKWAKGRLARTEKLSLVREF